MPEHTTSDSSVATPTAIVVGLTIAMGVILPGIAKYALTQAGYSTLGTVVWVMGFGGVALAFWFRWIRPLDLTGPK
ncbi:hypothetical protein [Haloarchaeobius sp. TZWWS8]|uniref:hypothetical protein n=1 Tax=Haloarchaeobius sp. TZWWS8 TaxID=3446121 RepID=UPI003EBD9363